MPYLLRLDDGRAVNARIDLAGGSVILHSNGGATGGRPRRNTGYAEALIGICQRSRSEPLALEQVLIDSWRARRRPEPERILISRPEIETLDAGQLVKVLRARMKRFDQAEGTKGGNSTKQIRFDYGLDEAALISLLRLQEGEFDQGAPDAAEPAERLSAEQLRRVTSLDIRYAVDRLVAGEDAPRFSPSRDYDVVLPTGERLAPKKIFALALEQALGFEALPGHFSAGWKQPCFELIQRAGFVIVDKSAQVAEPGAGHVPPPADPDEVSWAEGNSRFAEHLRIERRRSRQAVAAKRVEVRKGNAGRLACENPACITDWYAVFPPQIAEAVFEIHHTVLVSTMAQDHRTWLDDLQCLCAACHRAEHQRLRLGVC